MAQPPDYTRQADFSAFAAANPATPLSGVSLDAELNRIKATVDAILTNIALIQRDDGDLANLSVGVDQLRPDVDFAISTVADWTTATLYRPRAGVFESSILYRCLVRHTSGTFATDLAAGYWAVVVDLNGATGATGPTGPTGPAGPSGISVSGDDTTPGTAEAKLIAGTAISMTTQNGGGNETRTVSVDLALVLSQSLALGG